MVDNSQIFSRILQSLGAKNAPEAAKKLGLSKQAVYDWKKSTPGLDNLFKISESTGTSLHWLLTGDGDRFVERGRGISIEQVLQTQIRMIIREEIADAGVGLKDLGETDAFDLEAAVEKYDNAIPILDDWYRHDGLTPPQFQTLAFSGWDKMSVAEKVREIRAVRGIYDRQQYRRKHVIPPKTP